MFSPFKVFASIEMNLAHDLPDNLRKLDVDSYTPLLEEVDRALFKLSNYRTYMEIGHDPEFRDKGINWGTIYGTEYMSSKGSR